MRIFVDTNIVIEMLADRKEAELVSRIFDKGQEEGWHMFLSVGSASNLVGESIDR